MEFRIYNPVAVREVVRLYVEDRMGIGVIADTLGLSNNLVRALLQEAGVPIRKSRARAPWPVRIFNPDLAKEITQLYVEEKMTSTEIATHSG